MTDIKETIQGLYALKTYLASKAIEEHGPARESLIGMQKVVDSSVNLLKEQEWQKKRLTPTEPNVSINAYCVKFYYCPHCQRPILKSGIIGRPRHCEDCGQAVKWND